MSAWLNAHRRALVRACAHIRAQPVGILFSTLVIGIAVALPLSITVLFNAVAGAMAGLHTEPNVSVFLSLAANGDDVRDIERRLKSHANARAVKFIPRESALTDMKRSSHLADLLAGMDANPLPHAFTIVPHSTAPPVLEAMRRDILAMPKVDTVTMDFEWAEKLNRLIDFARRGTWLLAAVLAGAVIFVTGNTIRLQLLTQHDEIAVARLIGATRGFVRRPFLYFGALQGAAAGTIATLSVAALWHWVGGELAALTASYGTNFGAQALSLGDAGIAIGGTALLGWLGAFVSVALFWRQLDTA